MAKKTIKDIDVSGKTELESARRPNLDKLAKGGICGMSTTVSADITPGSVLGHLAIFGYNPLEPKHQIGRGVLEALGIGFDLKDGDIAIRGNFCTIDKAGLITDCRAGRIPTEKCAETSVQPVKKHRFVLVFRGKLYSNSAIPIICGANRAFRKSEKALEYNGKLFRGAIWKRLLRILTPLGNKYC